MSFTTYIVNSFVYVYLTNTDVENIIRTRNIFANYYTVTTFRKSINVHVKYKILKCIDTVDDLNNYLNEFEMFVNKFIIDTIAKHNIQIRDFKISNVVLTGVILPGNANCSNFNPLIHLNTTRSNIIDFRYLVDRIKEEFGDYIFEIKIPRKEGSSFPGVIIKFFNSLEDKDKYLSGELEKLSPVSIKFFGNGKYTATNVKKTFRQKFVDIMNFVAKLPEEENSRKEIDIEDLEISI